MAVLHSFVNSCFGRTRKSISPCINAMHIVYSIYLNQTKRRRIAKNNLEPVCCKKQQKKSSWPVTGIWNRGPLKILKGIKLIRDDQGKDKISLESFRSFTGPLFCKPVTCQELFFVFLLFLHWVRRSLWIVTTMDTLKKVTHIILVT